MTHLMTEARMLLEDMRPIKGMAVQAKVAESILILPRAEKMLEALVKCVDEIQNRDEYLVKHRITLQAQVKDLRSTVWTINDELARIIGMDPMHYLSPRIPIKPLHDALKPILVTLDEMQRLLELGGEC